MSYWDHRRRAGNFELIEVENSAGEITQLARVVLNGLDSIDVTIYGVGHGASGPVGIEIPRHMFDNLRKEQLREEWDELVEAGAEAYGHHGQVTLPGHGGTHTKMAALRLLRKERES